MASQKSEFAKLIAPADRADFFRRYRAREYFHISGRTAQDEDPYLEGVDVLLQSQQLPAAFIEVYRDGTAIPVERWSCVTGPEHRKARVALAERLFALYREGATLILNGAHRSIPSVTRLCRCLALELGVPCQANIYVTPAGAQGFTRHADDHEVLILQLQGSKRWTLYRDNEEPYGLEMRTGELLYIPAGLGHEAVSGAAASVHMTIGMRPVYAYQVLEELARLARTDPAFQVPLTPAHEVPDWRGISLPDRLNAFLTATPWESLIERRIQKVELPDRGGGTGRLRDLLVVHQITEETRVCLREDVGTGVAVDGKGASVQGEGGSVTVPLFLKPTLEQLLTGMPIFVRQMRGLLSSEGKLELARRLILCGILRIETL